MARFVTLRGQWMIKYVALYRRPTDPDFDERYFADHLPMVVATPGLLRTEVARIGRVYLPGFLAEVEPHLIAEMYFESQEAMRTALRSPEWQRAGENLTEIGGIELVAMFAADVVENPIPTGADPEATRPADEATSTRSE